MMTAEKVEAETAEHWHSVGCSYLERAGRSDGLQVVATDGWQLIVSGDAWYLRAIAAFSRALELDPSYTRALIMRGHAHRNRLDDARARADFERALALGEPYAGLLLELVS